VYSSGPGIYTNIVIRHLLGLRRCFDWIEFDPVLPPELDGICCETTWSGRPTRLRFTAMGTTPSPRQRRITINGHALASHPIPHPYRPGGLRVPRSAFDSKLSNSDVNLVEVEF
jgi:cellobiose phosphorylase